MKKKIKRSKLIQVTKRDILLGDREEGASCPVARAIARSFHKKVGTYRVASDITVDATDHFISECPTKAYNWWSKFDTGGDVHPFTFTLRY